MPEQNGNTPNLGASLIALRDSLKAVHPADIKSGVKSLIQFMTEQMVIDDPIYADITLSGDYPALLESARGILAWPGQVESGFAFDLADYSKLLGAVHEWIFFPFAVGEHFEEQLKSGEITLDLLSSTIDELDRIATNLGIEVHGYEDHRGTKPVCLDPLSKYLHETSPQEILRQKGQLLLDNFAETWNSIGAPAAQQALQPAKRPPTAAFNGCAHFDETVKGYQTQAIDALRGIAGRVTSLVQRCAEKITPDARQDALLFSERASHAAESISGK